LLSVANSLGHTVTFSDYNGRGQPGKRIGVNGEIVEWIYDDRGRVTQATTRRNNLAASTTWTYAPNGLLASMTQPDGVVESYIYDVARRVTEIGRVEGDATFKRLVSYDAASNVTRIRGYIVDTDDRLIFDESRQYDEQNRLIGNAGAAQNVDNDAHSRTFDYDLNGNLTRITPLLGAATTMTYDALDRLSTRTDPLAGVSRFFYDRADQLTEFRDPRNVTTTFELDGFGQLWQETSPDIGTSAHVWNAAGLLTETTRADGGSLAYSYDGIGRRISTTASINAATETHTATWDASAGCANGNGRICRMVDPHQTLTLSYTPYGEIASQANDLGAESYTHGFQYDAQGRLDRIDYPGLAVTYQWAAGRALGARIVGATTPIVSDAARTYASNPNGNAALVDNQTFGNGKTRNELYDRDGRFYATLTNGKQGREAFFDANIRIKRIDNFNTGDNQTFVHDGLDRLTNATSISSGNQSFGYDLSSNRTTRTKSSIDTLTIDGTSNRLASTTGINRSFEHAPTGEITAIRALAEFISESGFDYPIARRNLTLSYDPFNRLKQITGQGLNASYQIAATNLRVSKTVNGQTTHFVYSMSGQLLYERDLASNRVTQHIYFDGKPIAMIRNGIRSYVLTDHLGRPELLMDDTQAANTVWKATLGPFDRERITIDTIGGYHLGFPGQYLDLETGFYYNIHRDYDPSTGRYLQPDPIGLMGGANRYGYVGQSPVMSVDPLGLAACYVLFRDYPVQYAEGQTSTWLGGHAGILTYDENGVTRYYEFGRYSPRDQRIIGARSPQDDGNVRKQAIPNLTMGKDGRPSAASTQNLREALSVRAGQGTETELQCDEDADENLIEDFVRTFANDRSRDPYSWNPLFPNHCRSFAGDALESGQ